jgi:hypothetical protein
MTLGWLGQGITCLPSSLSDSSSAIPTTLGVAIQTPTADGTLGQGTVFEIRWSAYNGTSQTATARLYVESRTDLSQVILADAVPVSGSATFSTPWDTSDTLGGPYVIYAEITAGTDTRSITADGQITIDVPPTLTFDEPTERTEFAEGDTLTISWTGFDLEGDGRVTLGLDPDNDHESGNEVFIYEGALPAEEEDEGTTDWNGTDLGSADVALGTYNLFAMLSDATNDDSFVDAGVQIVISKAEEEEEEETIGLAIVEPEDDTTLFTGGASPQVEIEFTVNQFDDVLIDLKIDTDDNHSNGNETTILTQRLIAGGTERDTYTWDGTYTDGIAPPSGPNPPAAGIYSLFIVKYTGSGATPASAEGPGLIFLRRTSETEPLMAILEPDTQQNITAGGYVTISWRDDDPDETATIRLAIDDDDTPGEGEAGSPTDMAELIILDGRDASADGDLQDSYVWQVPSSLKPGSYYVFGYVLVGSTVQQMTVGPARMIMPDPENP